MLKACPQNEVDLLEDYTKNDLITLCLHFCFETIKGFMKIPSENNAIKGVTEHMRILPHTHMGWPICVQDSPYAYGAIYMPHTHMGQIMTVKMLGKTMKLFTHELG